MIVFKLKKKPPKKYGNLGFVQLKGDLYVHKLFVSDIPYRERVELFKLKESKQIGAILEMLGLMIEKYGKSDVRFDKRKHDWVYKYMSAVQSFLNKNLIDVKVLSADSSHVPKSIVKSILYFMGFGHDVVSPLYYFYLMCYSMLFQREFNFRLHLIQDRGLLVPVNCEYLDPYLKRFESGVSLMTIRPYSKGWVRLPELERIKGKKIKPLSVLKLEFGELYVWPKEFVGICLSQIKNQSKNPNPVILLFPSARSCVLVRLLGNEVIVTDDVRVISEILGKGECNDLSLEARIMVTDYTSVESMRTVEVSTVYLSEEEVCALAGNYVKD